MRTRYFIVLIFIFFSFISNAQSLKRVKQLVGELSSEEYYGRGYVNKGDSLAAAFLGKKMDELGLKTLNNSRFQSYNMSVNTFPEEPYLEIDGELYESGKEYIPLPESDSAKGKYSIHWLTKDELLNRGAMRRFLRTDHSKSFIAIDSAGLNNTPLYKFTNTLLENNLFKAKGIILDANKNLKSSARTYKRNYACLKLKHQNMPYGKKELDINLPIKFIENYNTQNVVGYLPGEVDTCIVFSAHYDHLGMIGKTMFPGANDNASGVAMVLELARKLKKHKQHYSMLFILFSGEEAGLLGSNYYVNNPLIPLEITKIAINFDMIGTGTDALYAFNTKEYDGVWQSLSDINDKGNYVNTFYGSKAVYSSDHANFHKKGVPGIFFYTEGGNDEYHESGDTAEKLSYPLFKGIYEIVLNFVDRLSN